MTKKFIIGATIAIAAYDIYAAANKRDKAETITAVLRRESRESPIIPLALGMVMGHLFWSPEKTKRD